MIKSLAQTYFLCVAVSAAICAAHGPAAGSQAAAGEITGKVEAEHKDDSIRSDVIKHAKSYFHVR